MTRLRWKLLLAMLAVVTVTIGTSALMTRRVTHQEMLRVMVAVRKPRGGVAPIEQHFLKHGSWRGVETALDSMQRSVVVTDANHRVVAVSNDLRGSSVRVSADDTVNVVQNGARMTIRFPPVMVRDLLVYFLPERAILDPGKVAFSTLDRRLITTFAAAALVALLLTLLLSRQITHPIERLTGAVEEMAAGRLPAHVEARGHDEIAQLARSFNRMSDSIAAQEELRRRMVVDVAHELRTPLTNLRCELEAIQDGLASPDAPRIASLHEEALHLGRLVDDLQELAVAEAGGLQLHRERVDLGELVMRAVDLFRGEAERRSMQIAMANDGRVFVDADPTRVRQIVRNLVSNALQHTPDGGRVEVSVRRDGEVARVSVADNGRGIPAEQLEKIFERFYRVDEARGRDSGGAGLGLAIVRRLVEAHGGRVWAESGDAGATLTFVLPLAS
jgi:two-component system sensor histidine kinase BaeS